MKFWEKDIMPLEKPPSLESYIPIEDKSDVYGILERIQTARKLNCRYYVDFIKVRDGLIVPVTKDNAEHAERVFRECFGWVEPDLTEGYFDDAT